MTISQPLLERIIRAAGDIALTHFRDLKNLTIDKKSPRDFVTAADLAVKPFYKPNSANIIRNLVFGVKKADNLKTKPIVGLLIRLTERIHFHAVSIIGRLVWR